MPLPPYITHTLKDKNRYQTVYAKYEGSAAAPTAGLHFTEELFQKLEEKGVLVANVTLHVGLGTFSPVKVDDVSQHHLHTEFYQVTKEEADKINKMCIRDSRYLMSYIRKHDFKAFGYYRIVLGVVVLVYFFLFK